MRVEYSKKIMPLKWIALSSLLLLLLSLVFITDSLANRTYGPVKQNDYLSIIVKKSFKKSSLTNDQIMVAILRANPEAFRGGNINFLKQAVILVLPNEKDIATISKKEASALIAQHRIFFKKGKTGNFTNKPLILSADSEDKPTDGSSTDTASQTNDSSQADDSKKAQQSEIPPKIKLEIRKQKQEKDNKYKHVTSLEAISSQQNKTLKTLDEQIRILEEQLKADARDKLSSDSSDKTTDTPTTDSSTQEIADPFKKETTDTPEEKTLETTDEETTEPPKKEAIDSSTEAIADPFKKEVTDETPEEKKLETTDEETMEPPKKEAIDSSIEAIADPFKKEATDDTPEEKTLETTEEETTEPPKKEDTDSSTHVIADPSKKETTDTPAEKTLETTEEETTDTPTKEATESQTEVEKTTDSPTQVITDPFKKETKDYSTQPAAQPPIEEDTKEESIESTTEKATDISIQETATPADSSKEPTSLLSFIKSLSTGVILAALGVFTLGLLLSFFLLGRSNKQQVSTINSPLQKTNFKETIGKPLEIPDQESLLNPVIKTRRQDSSATPSSGKDKPLKLSDNNHQDTEMKINMARAYMDMGHIDASKEILEEVLKEGSEEQKETVQQMLSML